MSISNTNEALKNIHENLFQKGAFIRWWDKNKKEYAKVLVESFNFLSSSANLLDEKKKEYLKHLFDFTNVLSDYYAGKRSPDDLANVGAKLGIDPIKTSDEDFNKILLEVADWFSRPNDYMKRIVAMIDPSLEYVSFIGQGYFSIVLKVKKDNKILALKINQHHEAFLNKAHRTLENEFNIMSNLSKIEGIPKVYKLYDNAPCFYEIETGKNAMLMEYIEGKNLRTETNTSDSFFRKLHNIINEINAKGYHLPDDFNPSNVIVHNFDPYIIDFMGADKLSDDPVKREEQINFTKDMVSQMEQRYVHS